MTAKEEVLETIRLWIAAQNDDPSNGVGNTNWDAGYLYALQDLTELLDAL